MAARLPVLGRLAKNFNKCVLTKHISPLLYRQRCLQTSASVFGATKLRMPSLSPTMYEGNIVQWLKKEGDPIAPGDIICEIQTDKAVVGFEVEEEGILAKILKPDTNEKIKINTLIALLVEEGEDWQNVEIPEDAESAEASTEAPPSGETAAPTGVAPSAGGAALDYHSYGPAVRSILDIYSIKPGDVKGSGPHDRLLKGDLLQYIKDKNLKPVPPPSVAAPKPLPASAAAVPRPAAPASKPLKKAVPDGATYVDLDLTNMRKVIGKRLSESKATIPHAYSTIDCNISQLLQLRKDILEEGVRVSVNDFIIKAVAVTLQRVPEVNVVWTEDGGRVLQKIDISVAVATEAGLITPIIKNAVGLGVQEISNTIKELAGRARDGKLRPEEFQGGSFTISNLGMFGVSEFTAIINPPQACIMAVGTSRNNLDLDGNPQTMMKVTVSTDRRIIDEFLAAKFLETFQEIMENPMLMLSQGPKVDLQKLFAK